MARIDVVRDWLKALGVLSAGSMLHADAKAKIAAYSPMLAADFADWCFTPASLAACARRFKFFPSFGELSAELSDWRKDNTPSGAYDKPRLAAPSIDRSEADDERLDREWWTDRIDRISSLPGATEAWREAMGMREYLTRPSAAVRQWAVDRLTGIIANAAAAGADTDQSHVRFATPVQMVAEPIKTYAEAAE